MTSRDFCYWLQGFFELAGHTDLTIEQGDTVKAHLALVFKHEIDPSMGSAEHQVELNKAHAKIGGVDPITGLVYRC